MAKVKQKKTLDELFSYWKGLIPELNHIKTTNDGNEIYNSKTEEWEFWIRTKTPTTENQLTKDKVVAVCAESETYHFWYQ